MVDVEDAAAVVVDQTVTSVGSNITTTDIDAGSFKSSLPPRKRAKTQEEKEQRKIERILRNRRAAHASREKKRKHVEYLEIYVVKLEENLKKLQDGYQSVVEKLNKQNGELESVTEKNVFDLGLEDLAELKSQIHLNMNGGRRSCKKDSLIEADEEEYEEEDMDEDSEINRESLQVGKSIDLKPPVKKRKLSKKKDTKVTQVVSTPTPLTATSPNTITTTTTTTMTMTPFVDSTPVHIKAEDTESHLKPEADNTFFNYLSPVSIHSPVNSPIDLTLTGNLNPNSSEVFDMETNKNTVSATMTQIDSPLSITEDSGLATTTPSSPSSSSSPLPPLASSSSSLSSSESNFSLYETGQNSAVILSVELGKQLQQSTVGNLNCNELVKLAIAV
ncbi:HAC1 [Candida oxycetoniae]|uniref:HAC1 n=1 Tax=Candida oxycetoniae TaxID=497107 RepID=A0AAI9WX63_9ASCO|nr:HAC1 [Candida oxycetoniae]KAI3403669.2 HAC1 [Candida oxycetoniae]